MGISSPNYTAFPNELLDEWLGVLPPSDWCVLSYLVRHTFGYHRRVETLTYKHILYGITRADGSVVDRGCGIKSFSTVHKSLEHLQEVGLIDIIPSTRPNGATARNSYQLCVDEEAGQAFATAHSGITPTVMPAPSGITPTVMPALQKSKSQGITATVMPIKDRKENPKENPTEKKTVCGAGKPRRARAALEMVATTDDTQAPTQRRLALKLAGDVLGCRVVNVERLARYEAFTADLLAQGWTARDLSRWMDWMASGTHYWAGKSRMWEEGRMMADLQDWDGDGRPAEKEDD